MDYYVSQGYDQQYNQLYHNADVRTIPMEIRYDLPFNGREVAGVYDPRQHSNYQQVHPNVLPIHQLPPSPPLLPSLTPINTPSNTPSHTPPSNKDHRSTYSSAFAMVLMARNLPGVKLPEEPVTCLNQGQWYEIKMKKQQNVGGTNFAVCYKSNIRLMFHHRRLQHSEQELFQSWLTARPGQRLLELDHLLGYNVLNPKEDPRTPNMATITWRGQAEASVSVKINCISTEFTAKKHGGEKGVPFRLQVDTYAVLDEDDENSQLVHRAYCLVKVFKPNGADRKNKNDSVKFSKIPPSLDQYHPSYDATVLTEVTLNQNFTPSPVKLLSNSTKDVSGSGRPIRSESINLLQSNISLKSDRMANDELSQQTYDINGIPVYLFKMDDKDSKTLNFQRDAEKLARSISFSSTSYKTQTFDSVQNEMGKPTPPIVGSAMKKIVPGVPQGDWWEWLKAFEEYEGSETLKMTKKQFMDVYGFARDLRFHNNSNADRQISKQMLYVSFRGIIEAKSEDRQDAMGCNAVGVNAGSDIKPRPTTNSSKSSVQTHDSQARRMQKKRSWEDSLNPEGHQGHQNKRLKSIDNQQADDISHEADYCPVLLDCLTRQHLIEKLSRTFNIAHDTVTNVYYVLKQNVNVIITDQFVEQIKDNSAFVLEVRKDEPTGKYAMFLFPS